MTQFRDTLVKLRTATISELKNYEHNEEQKRFTACGEKADPNEEKDITKQLSKFEEEMIPEKLAIHGLLSSCQDAENLNNELLIIKVFFITIK